MRCIFHKVRNQITHNKHGQNLTVSGYISSSSVYVNGPHVDESGRGFDPGDLRGSLLSVPTPPVLPSDLQSSPRGGSVSQECGWRLSSFFPEKNNVRSSWPGSGSSLERWRLLQHQFYGISALFDNVQTAIKVICGTCVQTKDIKVSKDDKSTGDWVTERGGKKIRLSLSVQSNAMEFPGLGVQIHREKKTLHHQGYRLTSPENIRWRFGFCAIN